MALFCLNMGTLNLLKQKQSFRRFQNMLGAKKTFMEVPHFGSSFWWKKFFWTKTSNFTQTKKFTQKTKWHFFEKT